MHLIISKQFHDQEVSEKKLKWNGMLLTNGSQLRAIKIVSISLKFQPLSKVKNCAGCVEGSRGSVNWYVIL